MQIKLENIETARGRRVGEWLKANEVNLTDLCADQVALIDDVSGCMWAEVFLRNAEGQRFFRGDKYARAVYSWYLSVPPQEFGLETAELSNGWSHLGTPPSFLVRH